MHERRGDHQGGSGAGDSDARSGPVSVLEDPTAGTVGSRFNDHLAPGGCHQDQPEDHNRQPGDAGPQPEPGAGGGARSPRPPRSATPQPGMTNRTLWGHRPGHRCHSRAPWANVRGRRTPHRPRGLGAPTVDPRQQQPNDARHHATERGDSGPRRGSPSAILHVPSIPSRAGPPPHRRRRRRQRVRVRVEG